MTPTLLNETKSALAPARPPAAAPSRIEVGRVDDPAEHEADRVAAQLLPPPGPDVLRRRAAAPGRDGGGPNAAAARELAHVARRHGGSALFVQRAACECGCSGAGSCGEDERLAVQPSLVVGPEDDAYERQADQVADRVVRAISGGDRVHAPAGAAGTVQRQTDGAEEEEAPAGDALRAQIEALLAVGGVRAKSPAGVRAPRGGFAAKLGATAGRGRALPEPVKTEMETAFGADFGAVRLHTDNAAASMSREINAHAFTHGRDIYFDDGKFDPSTADGRHLLAHELTHTLQQGGDSVRRMTVTRNSRTALGCGGFDVVWTFTLGSAAPEEGYIVQRVRVLETMQACPSNVGFLEITPKKEYWEAWKVHKGDTVDWTTTRDGWTDEATHPAEAAKSGTRAQLGNIKFFLRTTTGDLGDFGSAPAAPGSAWGPGREPMSGALPSTTAQPSWWNNAPADGPAMRWASSWWNCCGDPATARNEIDSSP